jgi:hypothetical protein
LNPLGALGAFFGPEEKGRDVFLSVTSYCAESNHPKSHLWAGYGLPDKGK